MKFFRLFLLAVLSLSTFALKAQTYDGSFGSFEVAGGKVTVTPGTTTTSITFQVICFRVANGTGFKDFKMNFKLASELANGSRNLIDNPIFTMTSSDFNPGVGGGSKQFTATINNNSLPVGGYIRIAYNIPSVINGVEYKAYTISDAYRYPIVAPTAPDPSPATLSKITSMGFSTTGLKVANNYYVVENDVRLYKAPLAESSYTNWKVDNTNAQNVNIEIDESVWGDFSWYNDLLEAIRVWNSNPGSNVKLNLIFSTFNYPVAPRVDITMRGNSSIATPTESTFPDGNGKAGQNILVKSNYISPSGDNVVNLIHAIGHNLGLKHTPTNTPNYSNSVMKVGPATVGIWSLLVGNYELPSAYDNSRISTLYPLNTSSSITAYINGPASFNSSASTTYRMSYISSENNITYSWKVTGIDGTTYNYTPSENNAALYDFGLPAGSYRLQCTISGGKYTTPVVVTKDIKSI